MDDLFYYYRVKSAFQAANANAGNIIPDAIIDSLKVWIKHEGNYGPGDFEFKLEGRILYGANGVWNAQNQLKDMHQAMKEQLIKYN